MSTENEIIAGNKLIAEFMGYEQSGDGIFLDKWEDGKLKDYIRPNDLQYHTSLDCLITVWVKVKYIGADLGRIFEKYHNSFHVAIDKGDCGLACEAVVNFINWYNTSKQIK